MRAILPVPFALLLAAAPVTDREWTLGESTAPLGAGGRPATLRLESATSRAVGFGGCNRFSASYRLSGDSLSFGPVASTRMACADGDALERSFLATMPAVATYQVTDSILTLSGPDGVLVRFRSR